MYYLEAFLLTILASILLTPYVKKLAFKIGAIDQPDRRKIHKKPIARLGGLAIYFSFLLGLIIYFHFDRPLIGLLLGGTILLIIGIIDDVKGLSPLRKLSWQILAACVALAGGIGITTISNPLGGVIQLDLGRFPVDFWMLHFHITPIANFLTILWIVGIVNTINFLDGLDGLACGVSGIAAIIMFLLNTQSRVDQPQTALIAIILAGAIVGFLPYNFYPAKIFLGDGGSYFLGLTLALLSIYSGGKLATAALILGFTIIDGIWTVIRRLYNRVSIFQADKKHLHHLLLELGLPHRLSVLIFYLIALLFGTLALFLNSYAKLIVLILLALLTILLIISLFYFTSLKNKHKLN